MECYRCGFCCKTCGKYLYHFEYGHKGWRCIMLYTSYFANWRNFKELVQVSISLKPPNGYKGLGYKKLAPSSSILFEYKTSPDEIGRASCRERV